jgi:hypothetical protein
MFEMIFIFAGTLTTRHATAAIVDIITGLPEEKRKGREKAL